MKLLRIAPIAAVTIALTLAGCGEKEPVDAKPQAPVEETTPAEAPEPVAEPEPATFVFPKGDCAAVNPEASAAAEKAIAELGMTVAVSSADLTRFNATAGPKAQEAFAAATQVRGCAYPFYLNGQSAYQWIAELPEGASKALKAALEGSDYTPAQVLGAQAWTYTEVNETPEWSGMGTITTHFAYVNLGDAWIAHIYQGENALDYVDGVVTTVKAVNPGL